MDKPFLIGELLGKDLLICSLCSEYYKDPRILPCQDTFCRKCLQNIYDDKQSKTSGKVTSMPCPKCHCVTMVPQIGVSGYPLDMNIRKKKEEFMDKLMDNVGNKDSPSNSLPKTARRLLEERQKEQAASRPGSARTDWSTSTRGLYDRPKSPEDLDYLRGKRPTFSPGAAASSKRSQIVDGLIRSRRERSPHVSTRNAPSSIPNFVPMEPYVDEETHANRPFSGSRPARLASPRAKLNSGARHKSDPGFNEKLNAFKVQTSPDGYLSPNTSTYSDHTTLSPEFNNNFPSTGAKVKDTHDSTSGRTAAERQSRSRRNVHFPDSSQSNTTPDSISKTEYHPSIKTVKTDSRSDVGMPKVSVTEQRGRVNGSNVHSPTSPVTKKDGPSVSGNSQPGPEAHKEARHRPTSSLKKETSPIKLPAPPPSSSTSTGLSDQKSSSSESLSGRSTRHSTSHSGTGRSAPTAHTVHDGKMRTSSASSSSFTPHNRSTAATSRVSGRTSTTTTPTTKSSTVPASSLHRTNLSSSSSSLRGNVTSPTTPSPRGGAASPTTPSPRSSATSPTTRSPRGSTASLTTPSPRGGAASPTTPSPHSRTTTGTTSPHGSKTNLSSSRKNLHNESKSAKASPLDKNTATSPRGGDTKVETVDFSNDVRTSPGKVRRRPSIPTSLKDKSLSPDGRKPYTSPTRDKHTSPVRSKTTPKSPFGTNSLPRNHRANMFTFDTTADKTNDTVVNTGSDADRTSDKNRNIPATQDRKIITNATKNDVIGAHITRDLGGVKGQERVHTTIRDKDVGRVKGQDTDRSRAEVPGGAHTVTSDTSMYKTNTPYHSKPIDKLSTPGATSHKGTCAEVLETHKPDMPNVERLNNVNKPVGTPQHSGSKSSVQRHTVISDTDRRTDKRDHIIQDNASRCNGYSNLTSTTHRAADTASSQPYDRPNAQINTHIKPSPLSPASTTAQHGDHREGQGRPGVHSVHTAKGSHDDTEIRTGDIPGHKHATGSSQSDVRTVYHDEEVITLAEVNPHKVISDSQKTPPQAGYKTPLISPDIKKSDSKLSDFANTDSLTGKKYIVKVERLTQDINTSEVKPDIGAKPTTGRDIPIIRNGTPKKSKLVNSESCGSQVNSKRITTEQCSEDYANLVDTKLSHSTPVQTPVKGQQSGDTGSAPDSGVDVTTDPIPETCTAGQNTSTPAQDSPWKAIYQDIYDDISREVSQEKELLNKLKKRKPEVFTFDLDSSRDDTKAEETLDTTDDADRSSLKDDSTQTPGGRISSEERQIGGAVNLEEPEEDMPEEEDMTPENAIYSTSERWGLEKRDYEMPTSLGILSSGTTVVAEFNSGHLQYFDSDGKFMHNVTGVKPFCITTTQDDQVIVADRKNKTIRGFDEYGVDTIQWEDDQFKWISGIGCLNNGSLVIYNRDNYKVGIYTKGGDKVFEFGSYGERDTQLCMADFLAVDSKDRILLCDSGNHCIKVFDATGMFLLKFGTRGHSNGQMEWPKGICCDKNDNIIVADNRNRRISLYSPNGEFIQQLVRNFPNPYGVCLNRTNNLLGLTHYALSGFSQLSMYSVADYVREEDPTDTDIMTDGTDMTDAATDAVPVASEQAIPM